MLFVGAASYFLYFAREGWQICQGATIECQVRLQYTTAQAADFSRQGVPFETMLALRYTALLVSSFFSLGIGLFIALQRSDDWIALLMSLLLIAGGTIANDGITGSLTRALPAVEPLVVLLRNLTFPLVVLALGLFPNGRPVPRRMRFAIPVMVFLLLLATNVPVKPIPRSLELGLALAIVTVFGVLLYSQILRYRRFSTFAQRKQTRWVVTGFVLVLITDSTGIILFSLDPFGDNQLLRAIVGTLCFTLLPGVFLSAFIGIAILRYRLWDIDILIRRTLTYALVTALLALVFFGSVILLQQLFANLTGSGQNELVTVLSTLAIAALFVPLRRRVQAVIDRRFNRQKYNAQQVLNDFAGIVRDETDLEKLTGRLIQVVDDTMQPKTVSVWLKTQKKQETNP
jgi:hypothetical protein